MFKQTMRFESVESAYEFDRHFAAFLRDLDAAAGQDACVFTASRREGDAHVRVVKTDSATVLGRLLSYLSARDFPPATAPDQHRMAVTN